MPETQAFLDWRELLMYQRSWLELYACQGFCLEGTANERMTRIVNGLTKHYGFKRDSDDIRYWTLHMGVDEEHMKVGPLAVERYAVTEPQQGAGAQLGAKNSRSVLARVRRHQAGVCRRRSALREAGGKE